MQKLGKISEKKFNNYGEIVTYTQIYAPPSGFEKSVPYTVAIVKLDGNGPMSPDRSLTAIQNVSK